LQTDTQCSKNSSTSFIVSHSLPLDLFLLFVSPLLPAAHDFAASKHQLPLARIKKIMKSDEDVRMISAEAPVLFAKACELFILDLTLRAWAYPEHGAGATSEGSSVPPAKRRTLQRNDIACAIQHAELFDFLQEIVPVLPWNPEEEGTPPHVRRIHNTAYKMCQRAECWLTVFSSTRLLRA
jgi:nuclear transcription factor Y gamma